MQQIFYYRFKCLNGQFQELIEKYWVKMSRNLVELVFHITDLKKVVVQITDL